MFIAIALLSIVVAVLLTGVILLQNSKGGGLAGAFGAGGTTQVLGVRRTADFLSRATAILAGVFFLLCIASNFFIGTKNADRESVIQKGIQKQPAASAPAVPKPAPAPQK